MGGVSSSSSSEDSEYTGGEHWPKYSMYVADMEDESSQTDLTDRIVGPDNVVDYKWYVQ